MTTDRSKTRIQVRAREYFLKAGIINLLSSENFDVSADETTEECDIIILCADPQNRLPEGQVFTEAVAGEARVVILAYSLSSASLSGSALMRAAAIVERDVSATRLLAALDAVMVGAIVRDPAFFRMPPELQEPIIDSQAAPMSTINIGRLPINTAFSAREREILLALTEGLPNKIIARRHAIAEATVKIHVKHILRKLNMSNRTQVAIWAKSNNELVA